jgi:hypothetical protein
MARGVETKQFGLVKAWVNFDMREGYISFPKEQSASSPEVHEAYAWISTYGMTRHDRTHTLDDLSTMFSYLRRW